MTLTMYPPQVNSPQTSLTAGINAVQTSITVVDGSLLPAAPNILVLGDGNDAETILYTSKAGNLLSGITRGFQGTAKAFAPGTNVARYFTAYDQEAIQGNISGHVGDVGNPHNVTVVQIGAETPAGAQHKADSAEASAKSYSDIHISNELNPHNVTISQIGAASFSEVKAQFSISILTM